MGHQPIPFEDLLIWLIHDLKNIHKRDKANLEEWSDAIINLNGDQQSYTEIIDSINKEIAIKDTAFEQSYDLLDIFTSDKKVVSKWKTHRERLERIKSKYDNQLLFIIDDGEMSPEDELSCSECLMEYVVEQFINNASKEYSKKKYATKQKVVTARMLPEKDSSEVLIKLHNLSTKMNSEIMRQIGYKKVENTTHGGTGLGFFLLNLALRFSSSPLADQTRYFKPQNKSDEFPDGFNISFKLRMI